jgi:hypothetical protein
MKGVLTADNLSSILSTWMGLIMTQAGLMLSWVKSSHQASEASIFNI